MNTLKCGAEEPLGPNANVRALNESSGVIEAATFTGAPMSRYSFVPGAESDPSRLGAIVLRAAAALDLAPSWLVAWDVSKARSPHRGGTLLAKLKNQRWQVGARGTLNLASAPLPPGGVAKLAPAPSDPVIAGWAVVFGPVTLDDWFDEPGFARTLGVLATAQPLQPSAQFVAALAARGLGVAYSALDSSQREGLIVLAPRPLGSELGRLERDGWIGAPLTGAAAESVWRG
jgi:hypothetical protein